MGNVILVAELKWVKRCLTGGDLMIWAKMGIAIRFAVGDLRRTGRMPRGVRCWLTKGDGIGDMDVLQGNVEEFLLALLRNGSGKRVKINEFRSQARGGGCVKGFELMKHNGKGAKDKVSAL